MAPAGATAAVASSSSSSSSSSPTPAAAPIAADASAAAAAAAAGPSSSAAAAAGLLGLAAARPIDDFELPRKAVARIIKEANPSCSSVHKDAKAALSKCCTVFINYLASTAHDSTKRAGRKNLTVQDIYNAMEVIQLKEVMYDQVAPAVKLFQEQTRSRRQSQKRKSQVSDKNDAEEEEEEAEDMEVDDDAEADDAEEEGDATMDHTNDDDAAAAASLAISVEPITASASAHKPQGKVSQGLMSSAVPQKRRSDADTAHVSEFASPNTSEAAKRQKAAGAQSGLQQTDFEGGVEDENDDDDDDDDKDEMGYAYE